MKDNRRLLLKGIVFAALLGLLIIKFALPEAEGPTETISGSNQAASQEEIKQPVADASQTNNQQEESPQTQEKKEAAKSVDNQSVSPGPTAGVSQSEQNEQSDKIEPEALPVWLLFRSTTCIPCVEMQKTMDALQPEFDGKVDFVAIDVNDPANQELLVQYQIRYIPTTYLYDRNKKLYFQLMGEMSVEEMRGKLQALMEVK
ncbi:MAG: thioredoxin family protein [Syntrophomonas sp.]